MSINDEVPSAAPTSRSTMTTDLRPEEHATALRQAIECVMAMPMASGVRAIALDALREKRAAVLAPPLVTLRALSAGKWGLRRGAGPERVLCLDRPGATRLEAAMRLLAHELRGGPQPVYVDTGMLVSDRLFPDDGRDRDVGALRNARNALAGRLEGFGFREVAQELRAIKLSADGGISFQPTGGVVIRAT